MTLSKRDRNIIVVSHKVVHQPDDDLVLYLNKRKYKNVLHIMHSFANASDRKSKYAWYKNGILHKEVETKDYKNFFEPVIYGKEFLFTLQSIFASNMKWDTYIGMDGLCMLFGNKLRSMGKVNKTIFWAIDFVPKNRFGGSIKNAVYNWINKDSYLNSDEMWDLSPRMADGREEYLGIKKTDYKEHRLVQYGLWIDRIKPLSYNKSEKYTLVFMGNIAEYQGLQLVIKVLPTLVEKYPKIKLTILGEGEYTQEIKKLVKKLRVDAYCTFLGRMKDNVKMEMEIAKSTVALAPYLHSLDSISRYADPGKIKTYLACGVPVLTTDVPWNAQEIKKNKCGLITSESEKDIINKITELLDSKTNQQFRKNALTYAKKFDYQNMFDQIFV